MRVERACAARLASGTSAATAPVAPREGQLGLRCRSRRGWRASAASSALHRQHGCAPNRMVAGRPRFSGGPTSSLPNVRRIKVSADRGERTRGQRTRGRQMRGRQTRGRQTRGQQTRGQGTLLVTRARTSGAVGGSRRSCSAPRPRTHRQSVRGAACDARFDRRCADWRLPHPRTTDVMACGRSLGPLVPHRSAMDAPSTRFGGHCG
jgi:hypothetical protein